MELFARYVVSLFSLERFLTPKSCSLDEQSVVGCSVLLHGSDPFNSVIVRGVAPRTWRLKAVTVPAFENLKSQNNV